MNYYNPYFYTAYPYAASVPKVGLFSRIFGANASFSSLLGGTQKVLNVANQAIPLIQQVKPMVGNAKTMFKVMNEFKKTDIKNTRRQNNNVNTNSSSNSENNTNDIDSINDNTNNPTFFV